MRLKMLHHWLDEELFCVDSSEIGEMLRDHFLMPGLAGAEERCSGFGPPKSCLLEKCAW